MADEQSARRVSGEIMAGPFRATAMTGHALAPDRGSDVIDADFLVVDEPHERLVQPEQRGPSQAASLEGMDMLRKSEPAKRRAARGSPLFWTAGIGLAFAAFWISGGHALVRQAPIFSTQDKGGALSISGIRSRVDVSGSKPVLLVDGEAGNDGSSSAVLPPLTIAVAGKDGSVTRYTLGTSRRELAAGERFGFSSRLDMPRNGVETVSVTFSAE